MLCLCQHNEYRDEKGKIFWFTVSKYNLLVSIMPSYSGFSSTENNTLIQAQGIQNMSSANTTSIVLVHGGWADGSGWSKQIPVLRDAGHKVIAVQLPLHSLSEDVETVKRAIAFIGGPQFRRFGCTRGNFLYVIIWHIQNKKFSIEDKLHLA